MKLVDAVYIAVLVIIAFAFGYVKGYVTGYDEAKTSYTKFYERLREIEKETYEMKIESLIHE